MLIGAGSGYEVLFFSALRDAIAFGASAKELANKANEHPS